MSTTSGRGTWRLIGVGVVTGGLVAIALSASGSNSAPPSPPFPASGDPMNYGGTVDVRGEGLSPNEAISSVLAAKGMEAVTDAEVVPAPADAKTNVPWLNVGVNTESLEGPNTVKTTWLAEIAQGAIAELMHTDEVSTNEVIGGSTIQAATARGEVPLDGGTGYVATGETFSSTDSDSDIIQNVTKVLQDFQLQPMDVEVLHPLGVAISVRARIGDKTDPKWTIDELRDALTDTPRAYEGIYLEVDSADGDPLLASGVPYRTGVGGLWFAPGQDERFGAVYAHAPMP